MLGVGRRLEIAGTETAESKILNRLSSKFSISRWGKKTQERVGERLAGLP